MSPKLTRAWAVRLQVRMGVFVALASLSVAEGVQAAENGVGVYILGSQGPAAGVVPPPGVYLQDDLYLYGGSADASEDLKFNGKIVAGVNADLAINASTVLWSTPIQIGGGNLALSATVPIGSASVGADAVLSAPFGALQSANTRDSVFTVGDPLVTATIGWHKDYWHWSAGATVNIPAGDYHEGSLANVAFHHWAGDLHGAVSWINPKSGLEVSGASGITLNAENPATQYRTGTEWHFEGALIQHFSPQFDVGVVGYVYRQLTADSGSGAVLGPFEGRVSSLGLTAGYTFMAGKVPITTRFRFYREFETVNRLQGTAAFLTLAMPLSVGATTKQ